MCSYVIAKHFYATSPAMSSDNRPDKQSLQHARFLLTMPLMESCMLCRAVCVCACVSTEPHSTQYHQPCLEHCDTVARAMIMMSMLCVLVHAH